jgi:hypothetical protein
MKDVYWNLLLFAMILLGLYIFFSNYNNMPVVKEGLENQSSANGIAGNSKTYLENIKQFNIQMKDKLNINNSEYRKNYEDIILALDDYINYTMLDQILKIPINSDINKENLEKIIRLGSMNETRTALNNILKFVDKQ